MRWRALALISLGINIMLGGAWLLSTRHPRTGRPGGPGGPGTASTNLTTTNLLLRRLPFSWQEIESPDYAIYILNLRAIGCPEQTIKDIIIADVGTLYARKRATEVLTPDQQWWRTEPDTNVLQAAVEKVRALEEERRALLTQLLGSNWEAGDMVNLPRPSRPAVVLDGPILGVMPAETKQALQDLSIRSQERVTAYLEAQQKSGQQLDPVELAKLRQQTRNELQRILSPPQLEEYLLRYSQNANDLRAELGELRFFGAGQDEFRTLFRVTDALDQQIALLAGNDPATLQHRKALADQRENAIKTALGQKRYAEYQALHDPMYRDAMAVAQEAGLPDAAQTIYAINLAAAEEQESIRTNSNLTAAQKALELKRLEMEQLQANAVATDQELPPEPPSPPKPALRRVYVVGPGDSAATVSMIYGVPIAALRDANPKVNFSRLKPGDSITIPRNPLLPSSAP
jgi:LysM repeat protein